MAKTAKLRGKTIAKIQADVEASFERIKRNT